MWQLVWKISRHSRSIEVDILDCHVCFVVGIAGIVNLSAAIYISIKFGEAPRVLDIESLGVFLANQNKT